MVSLDDPHGRASIWNSRRVAPNGVSKRSTGHYHFPTKGHAVNSVDYHHKIEKEFLSERHRESQKASVALAPKQGDQRLEIHHRQHQVRQRPQLPDSAQDFDQRA